MQLKFAILVCLALVLGLAAACEETPNGCEEAKKDVEALMDEICAEPSYAGTAFCACCVANRLYSVGNDCSCRGLLFDAEACYFARGDQAKPQVREAVEFANEICEGREVTLPAADGGIAQCRQGDGGAPGEPQQGSSTGAGGSSGAGGAGNAGGSGGS